MKDNKRNLTQDLINLLNFRIEQEELSSRMYKAMSIWLNYNGFFGAAALWNKYAIEEQEHAEWAYKYLLDLDVMPRVPALMQVQTDFTSLIDVIEKSYNHEVKVTNQCQELGLSALKNGDFMTLHLAQQYLDEQKEEIAKIINWLDRLTAFGTDQSVLYLLDKEMKKLT